MLFPIRGLLEPDDAPGGQPLLADVPSPQLAPVKHRHRLVRLRPGGGLRVFASEDADAQLGGFPADLLKRDHPAADNSMPDIGIEAAVDWGTARRSERIQRLARGEGLAVSILKHREIKHNSVIR